MHKYDVFMVAYVTCYKLNHEIFTREFHNPFRLNGQ